MLATLAACSDDDYTDWASPQSNTQEAQKEVALSLTSVEQIDFANVTADSIKIFDATATLGGVAATPTEYDVVFSDEGNTQSTGSMYADAQGRVSVTDLTQAVTTLYGSHSEYRTLVANVTGYIPDGNTTLAVKATTNVVAKLIPAVNWYLVGGCIGDGSWGNNGAESVGTSLIPMVPNADGSDVLTFTGYFTTDGFKIIHTPGSWDEQWGMSNGQFVKNDGNSSNITVPTDGYYTLTLNTATDEISLEPAAVIPTVYTQIYATGDFNGWSTPGEVMTPVNTNSALTGHNHVWSYVVDATGGDTTIKFKIDSWDVNWGAASFPTGIGTNGGANIPVKQGKWVVVFNDVDGGYTFTEL